jgi:protein SCO1/2
MLAPRYLLPAVMIGLGLVLFGTAAWLNVQAPQNNNASLIGGPFALHDEHDAPITEQALQGHVTLVFFGYTHCPDVCPTTLFDLSQVLAQFTKQEPVQAYFITIDPERDTPALLRDYLSSFDQRIHGLSGARADIDHVVRAYRAYARKVPGADGSYTMDHSALVYVMDKSGHFISSLNLDVAPDITAQQLRRLL